MQSIACRAKTCHTACMSSQRPPQTRTEQACKTRVTIDSRFPPPYSRLRKAGHLLLAPRGGQPKAQHPYVAPLSPAGLVLSSQPTKTGQGHTSRGHPNRSSVSTTRQPCCYFIQKKQAPQDWCAVQMVEYAGPRPIYVVHIRHRSVDTETVL